MNAKINESTVIIIVHRKVRTQRRGRELKVSSMKDDYEVLLFFIPFFSFKT